MEVEIMDVLWRIIFNPIYRKLIFVILAAIFLISDFILLTNFQSPLYKCSEKHTLTPIYNFDNDQVNSKAKCYVPENCSEAEMQVTLTKPSLTLFTSFEFQKEKYLINTNTLKNWKAIQGNIKLVLFTNTSYVRELGLEAGWFVLPIPRTGSNGSPVVKAMYEKVMEHFDTSYYALANADILFDNDLSDTLSGVSKFINDSNLAGSPVLIVGRRTNIPVADFNMSESTVWSKIVEKSYVVTQKFSPDAIDYFIVNNFFSWERFPEFVLGRRGYDNWLLAYARYKGFIVIDSSSSVLAIHQTSSLGNFENFLRDSYDMDYNIRIISEYPLPYSFYKWGSTDCCDLKAVYKCGHVVVLRNFNVPKKCYAFSSFTFLSIIKKAIGLKENYFE